MAIWFDVDHDGRSAPHELRSLTTLGLVQRSLNYAPMRARDSGGNTIIFESRGVLQRGRAMRSIRIYDALVRTSLSEVASNAAGR
jgi:hypothetical protein